MDVVAHETGVVEVGGIAGFSPGQAVEEIVERGLLGEQELAVVAPGDEMVTAPIDQGTRRTGHQCSGLGVTIRDASGFPIPTPQSSSEQNQVDDLVHRKQSVIGTRKSPL